MTIEIYKSSKLDNAIGGIGNIRPKHRQVMISISEGTFDNYLIFTYNGLYLLHDIIMSEFSDSDKPSLAYLQDVMNRLHAFGEHDKSKECVLMRVGR